MSENTNAVTTTESSNNPKKPHNFCITEPELLYKVSDEGLLHTHLRGVHRSKKDPQKFVWFVKRDNEINGVINQYCKEKERQ